MLKQRIVTGAVLIAVATWGILALPTAWFGLGLLLFVLVGAWEWGGLLGLADQFMFRIGYCALVLGITVLAWSLLDNQLFIGLVLTCAGLYWCSVLSWLWHYAADPHWRNPRSLRAIAGIITLVAPWVALMSLHGTPLFGPFYVLFLMGMIWIADSGAYFAGRRWGRHKLAPHISPGKTWEGVAGALLATLTFAALGAGALGGLAENRWLPFVATCMAAVLFSIVGDLFESMIKRQHAVKDSGGLLPGHGGVLDRVDSLTAAAPVFLLGLQAMVLWTH
ncbi:MAG: phosphatidate cytidylyltransferase [Gammaproteobacteria bacterium]|nr:phosphatidate cytidylyltransferase [Gammaproteobacteria bacterium]MCP5458816.1 phosphatidate cytidylyltransferase [Gammaproteobacteria bacterium]